VIIAVVEAVLITQKGHEPVFEPTHGRLVGDVDASDASDCSTWRVWRSRSTTTGPGGVRGDRGRDRFGVPLVRRVLPVGEAESEQRSAGHPYGATVLRLVRHKRRWRCVPRGCARGSFTETVTAVLARALHAGAYADRGVGTASPSSTGHAHPWGSGVPGPGRPGTGQGVEGAQITAGPLR
jgi:hypothetical protein